MLTKEDIQKLQDLPIEQVAEALTIKVSKHKSICPFHDDTRPSLSYNVKRNRFRCFVCDANGSSIDLVMKSQGWTFYDSCHWLARQFGVTISEDLGYFQERALKQQVRKVRQEPPPPPIDVHYLEGLMATPYLCEDARHFLFDERKISPSVVSQVGLSSISSPTPMSGNPNGPWFNAPSLLIPYRDVDGRLLSVQARYLGKNEFSDNSRVICGNSRLEKNLKNSASLREVPRFQFPKGSRCSIFNLPILKTLREGEDLWITEGVTDCLAMMSSGRKAIAIPSATLLKPDDVALIRSSLIAHHSSAHMAPDNDIPGEHLFLQLKSLLEDESLITNPSSRIELVHHLLPAKYKDFGEYWKNVKLLKVKFQ